MEFEYNKLKGRIVEVFGTQAKFSNAMGWSMQTTTKKLNNIRFWKQTDICKAAEILNIQYCQIPEFFFQEKVQNFEPDTAKTA